MNRIYRAGPGLTALLAVTVVITGCGGSHKSASSPNSPSTDGSSVTAGPSGSASGPAGSSGAGSSSGAKSSGSTAGRTTAPGGTSAHPSSTAPGGQEGASAPSVNACTTADASDVTKAFGGKVVSATTSTTGTGAQLCRFVLANAKAAKNMTISLSVHKPVTAADFNAGRASAVKAGATSVSGVGSGAYYSRSTGTLQFLAGSTGGFVEVQAPLAPGSTLGAAEPGAIALAKAVIANL